MQDYVLGFDVPVDDAVGVDFVDCLTDLLHDKGYPWFREGLWLFQLMIELSSGSHLKDDEYVGGIVKASIELYDVGMI